MLYQCTTCVRDKRSSTSHFIKVKSRDLEKVLGYWSEIVVWIFKDGTGGCCGWSASHGFAGSGSVFGISPTDFVLYSND